MSVNEFYIVKYNGGAKKCDDFPKIEEFTVIKNKKGYIEDECHKNIILTSETITNFSVRYNPSGYNVTSLDRVVTAIISHEGKDVGYAYFTQMSGECYGCETEYDTALTFECKSEVEKCDTSVTVSNVVVYGTYTCTDGNSGKTSTILKQNEYTVNTFKKNESNEDIKITITVNASSYGASGSKVITQKAGPCTVQTGTTTEYDIQVIGSTIEACSTSVSPTVQGSSRTGTTYSDGTPTSWGTWSDWSDLSSSDYSLSFNPTIGANKTSSEKTYTVTVTGKGNYVGKTDTATITQAAGPCDTATTRTEYKIRVLGASMGKCETTVSPIVQGSSRIITSHTDGSADEVGEWSDWSDLNSSDYSLSYNPSLGVNTTSSEKTYTVTVTGKGNYVGKTGTETITQAPGPCDTATTRTEYQIQVIGSTIEACDTSASPTVQGSSRTITSHTDGSGDEVGKWSDWSNLSSSDYSLSYSPSISINQTPTAKTYEATVTGKGKYVGKSDTATITQAAGPCCTVGSSWTSLSVTASTVAKCDTNASFTVKANGTYTDESCSTTSTSATLSSSDYTVKYGTSSGSYTLDSITENNTSSSKTWYYKITASSTYGNLTYTSSFTQAPGPCKDVYVFETVLNPLEGVTIASSGVTFTPQGFLSTKNDEYCPITATPNCDWITIDNISSGSVGNNGNVVVNISFAANETTESRTCSVVYKQDGSNKEIIHSFTQEGKEGCGAYIVYDYLTVTVSTVAKCDTSASFSIIANGTYFDELCETGTTSSTLSSGEYEVKYGTSSGNYTLNNITKNETTSPKTWYYEITTTSSIYNGLTYTGSFTQAPGPCESKAYVGGIKIQSNAVGSISYSGFGKSGSIYAGNSFEYTNKEWYSSSSNLTVTVPVSSISNGNYLNTSAAIQIIVTGTNLSFISTNVPDGIRNTGSDVGTSGGYIAFVVVPESSSISSSSLVGKTATCVFQDFNNTTTPVTIVATIKFT